MFGLESIQMGGSTELRHKTLLIFSVLVFLMLQSACDNCPSSDKGCIRGSVLWKKDKKPVENTRVVLCRYVHTRESLVEPSLDSGCVGKVTESFTNAEGIYWFQDVPPGKYAFQIEDPSTFNTYTYFIKKDPSKPFDIPKYAEEFSVRAGQTTELITLEVGQ